MAVLISGHIGSGKSVLRRLLHDPPTVVLLDDVWCFRALDVSLRGHVRGLRRPGRRASFAWAGRRFGYDEYLWHLARRTFPNRPVGADDVETALRRTFTGSAIVGDAANLYCSRIAQFERTPCVKHIVIYRDGRDVAAEMRRRFDGMWARYADRDALPDWLEELATPEATARHWQEQVHAMEAGGDTVRRVRYEDLVTDPDAVLTPLRSWLGIDGPHRAADGLTARHVGEFRDILTDSEIASFEVVAGETLRRLGYR